LKATVYKDGIESFLEFSYENDAKKETTDGIKTIGKTDKHGTKVTFMPNFELFNNGVDGFDFEVIKTRLKETAYLNKNLIINIKNENDDEKLSYKFEGGLIDFIQDLNQGKEKITCDVVYAEGSEKGIQIEVSMQYTTSYQTRVLSYVNNIATIEGGTHEQGFYDATLRIINNYAEANLPIKEKRNFKREDIKEGLTAVISVKHPDPMYEGQTKAKFTNLEVRKIVNNTYSEKFESYMAENPMQAGQIIAKIKQASKAREAADKAREATRRKDVLGFSTLPGKLADCSSTNKEETEIFIVEGDSAGGSAKMGRDREIQAILPLKGKVINAERARIDKLFNNNEITSMITAFGTGIGEEFNIEKLRYGKIIIMTDADVDGSHITTLLLTFFFRFFQELIKEGYIYIACSPLFKVTQGKKEQYLYTEDEKDAFFANEEDITK